MNLKAIIASLVLGSSSLAMAAPGVTVSATVHGDYNRGYDRDDNRGYDRDGNRGYDRDDNHPVQRVPPPIMVPIRGPLPPVYRSVTLASQLAFTGQGRRFITVGAQAGRFDKVEIRGAGGRTFIKQVYVQFTNGQEQVVRNLDRTLAGNACLTVDLDGNHRAIRRIVVYGSDLDNGFRHEANAFNVVAS